MKRGSPTPDWTITFEDASSIRLIVEAASAVMQRALFKIAKSEGGYVLSVDGADIAYTCCVSARLRVENVKFNGEEGEFMFCIECKHVLIALDASPSACTSVVFEGFEERACIGIRLLDPDQGSHESCSELSTYVDGDASPQLTPMDFKITLEMDVYKLKDIIKKARKSHAELLQIRIFYSEEAGRRKSIVIFTVKGDNQVHSVKFCHDLTDEEDGSIVVRAAADGEASLFDYESLKADFDQTYPVDKLESFVKNIPSRMITSYIAPGLPILMRHDLKGVTDGSSSIKFLIAAVNEDDH